VSRLQVEGLQKLYGRKAAVQDVSFAMDPGEIVGLLGPNGAGKTTVFYAIVGFIRPTRGRVVFDGIDITYFPMHKRARQGIAYLPQEASVFRQLTVEKNVWAILETRRDLSVEAKRARLEQLIADLGLDGVRRQKAYTLSGGERRRTEIARSLALEPTFLLMDEPFAGIDPKAVTEIKRIVQRLAGTGIGVLITDHNVRDTLEITHRSYIIDSGQIVASGARDELLASPVAREAYLGHDFRM
jgi:lipopolysaccharide export system ATP-binding protein